MLELNKVYLGDCLEVMKDVDDKSIDMILCDLPYGITACKWDEVIPLEPLWQQYKRIIKVGGAIVLTATMPFGAKLIMSNPKWFRHEVIWEKDNGSNGLSANKMPMRVHENILIFCEKGTIYNPQMTIGLPYKHKEPTSFNHMRPDVNRIPTQNSGTRFPRSVQKFSREHIKLHITQKPLKLFEYLIKTYSNEGMTILDNCSGSGTTAIAAINTNRNWICIEKDENYYNLSNDRINKHIETKNPQNSSAGVRGQTLQAQ